MTIVGRREKREKRIAGKVRRCIVGGGSLMGRTLQIRGQGISFNFDLSSARTIM